MGAPDASLLAEGEESSQYLMIKKRMVVMTPATTSWSIHSVPLFTSNSSPGRQVPLLIPKAQQRAQSGRAQTQKYLTVKSVLWMFDNPQHLSMPGQPPLLANLST